MELMQLISIVLACCLIIIMFGMGTTISISDFKRLFTLPKAVLLGLFNQLICLPLLALVLVSTIHLPVDIAVGIIVIASCPGGPLSNLVTFMVKADVALSVSLTAISTTVSMVTLPFWISMALTNFVTASSDISLPLLPTVLQIALTTLLPVFMGMLLNTKNPELAIRIEKIVRKISMIFLFFAIIGFNINNIDSLLENLETLVLIGLFLNCAVMLFGYFSAFLIQLPNPQRITIAVETGIQNIPLALTITTIQLNSLEMALMPTLYGLCMIATSSLIIFFMANKNRDRKQEDAT